MPIDVETQAALDALDQRLNTHGAAIATLNNRIEAGAARLDALTDDLRAGRERLTDFIRELRRGKLAGEIGDMADALAAALKMPARELRSDLDWLRSERRKTQQRKAG